MSSEQAEEVCCGSSVPVYEPKTNCIEITSKDHPLVRQESDEVEEEGIIYVKSMRNYVDFVKDITATRVCKYCKEDAEPGYVWTEHYKECLETAKHFQKRESLLALTADELITEIYRLRGDNDNLVVDNRDLAEDLTIMENREQDLKKENDGLAVVTSSAVAELKKEKRATRKAAKIAGNKAEAIEVLQDEKHQFLTGLDLLVVDNPTVDTTDMSREQRNCIRMVTRELQIFRENK